MPHAPRLLAVLLLLWVNVAPAQYSELRPLRAGAQPVVRAEGQDGVTVQLGPVKLTFPPGWQFHPDVVGTKAIGSTGAVVDIMVLDQPNGRLAPLPDPRASLPKALTYFCESGSTTRVDLLANTKDREIYVGSCFLAKDTEDSPYTLIHEIRYPGRIVQIIHSGRSGLAAARVRQNSIAESTVSE